MSSVCGVKAVSCSVSLGLPVLDVLVAPMLNSFDGRCTSMESVSGELDAVRVVLC